MVVSSAVALGGLVAEGIHFPVHAAGFWTNSWNHPTLLILAERSSEPVLEQLDPPRRAVVVMALLALILLGLTLVVCTMIGARWVRRMARHKPGPKYSLDGETAAENQRLRNALRSVLPEAKTDDTIAFGKPPGETRIDE